MIEPDISPVELEPLGNRLVAALATTSEAGLILPLERKPTTRVTVTAAGGQVKDVAVGDEVLVKQGALTEVTVDDQGWLVFSESDVLAVVRRRR